MTTVQLTLFLVAWAVCSTIMTRFLYREFIEDWKKGRIVVGHVIAFVMCGLSPISIFAGIFYVALMLCMGIIELFSITIDLNPDPS